MPTYLVRTFSEKCFQEGGILADFAVLTESLLNNYINECDFLIVMLAEKQAD